MTISDLVSDYPNRLKNGGGFLKKDDTKVAKLFLSLILGAPKKTTRTHILYWGHKHTT